MHSLNAFLQVASLVEASGKKAKNKEDDEREGAVPQHCGYSLARMHGEREAAYFRDIGAEMEGSVTVLPCCISSTADAQTWQGVLNVKKFQGYKKRVDDLKMDILIHIPGTEKFPPHFGSVEGHIHYSNLLP
ncbi:hypothetical protein ARMGADRAFT_1037171 [Armillaria gallica]|uniref:Uncharacterized protein n=1 Tax=Armillaria gallica TaxID=47427 RepID=A0A2H3CZ34_ARMGA|nr:hypothetical protein ARMGADRAFT_1037171 [Armillaria gallica]